MDQARGDLEHARADLKGGYWDWACLGRNRRREKAAKAVFQRTGARAWGHSVADLLGMSSPTARAGLPLAVRDAALEDSTRRTSRVATRTLTRPAPAQALHARGGRRLIAYAEQIITFI